MGTRHGSADGTRMRESTLETSRLILRPWRESDAEALFAAAKNPDIGPRAGWNPHASVEESRKVIQDVLAKPESYAIVLKREAGADRPIGAIGLTPASDSSLAERDDEAEIGYWIDQPYWGHGYMPEAVVELIRHAFEDLGLSAVWCGYYEGNEQSSRVQEKTGFRPHHVIENSPRPLLGDEKTEYANRLTRGMGARAAEGSLRHGDARGAGGREGRYRRGRPPHRPDSLGRSDGRGPRGPRRRERGGNTHLRMVPGWRTGRGHAGRAGRSLALS